MNHIETLKWMRETCIDRGADALRNANVLAQRKGPGYGASKWVIDSAFETVERYAARTKALTYALAVMEVVNDPRLISLTHSISGRIQIRLVRADGLVLTNDESTKTDAIAWAGRIFAQWDAAEEVTP